MSPFRKFVDGSDAVDLAKQPDGINLEGVSNFQELNNVESTLASLELRDK